MRRNKLKVLSSLAILGIAGLGLAACNNNTGSGTTPSPTPTPTENGGGATTTPTPTPVPTTPSQTTTTTPNQSSTANTPAQKVVKSISISGGKTLYLVGEEFSFDGVVVTKTYNDETQETATADEVTYKIYSDEDGTKEATSIATAGTYYVYVTCGGKDNYYAITVQEKQYKLVTMFDPANNTAGNITENKELYNANGNKVSVLASSSGKVTIEANKYNKIEGYNFTTRLKLNGSALGSGATDLDFDSNGNVTNVIVVVLELEKDADVNIFARSGSSSETRTLAITDGGTYTKKLSCADAMEKQTVSLKAGKYYVYSESKGINIYGIEFETEVPASSVTYSEIKVDTSNAKTDFNKGDEFATTGLVVKGLNNYGVWDILDSSDYTITNEDGSAVDITTVGRKTLKVTAKGHSDTYVIQVINPNATLDKIEVKDHAKEVYKKGEEISLSGLTITTTDSDTLTQDIAYDAEKITYKVLDGETDVTSSFTTLTKGTYKVELTYASKTTTYDITILEVKEKVFTPATLTNVSAGTASFNTTGVKYTITYTDGTDKAYDSQTETITDLVVSWYADATTETKSDFATLVASAGTIYYTLGYGDDVSARYAVTVDEAGNTYTNEFDAVQYYKDQNYIVSQTIKSATVVGNIFTLHSDMRIKSDGLSANKVKSAFGDKKNNCIEFDVRNNFTGKLSITLARDDRYVYLYKVDNGTLTEVGKLCTTGDIENLEAGKYVIFFNEKDQTENIVEPKITKLTLVETKNAE